MHVSDEQRRVARGRRAASWSTRARVADVADRLAFALQGDLFVAGALGLCIAATASGRFFSPSDIAGSTFTASSPRIAVTAAVLQNTLDQATLAVAVNLALTMPLLGLGLLPLLAGLFCVGCLSFALGYRRGAAGRAFGARATFALEPSGVRRAIALPVSDRTTA